MSQKMTCVENRTKARVLSRIWKGAVTAFSTKNPLIDSQMKTFTMGGVGPQRVFLKLSSERAQEEWREENIQAN